MRWIVASLILILTLILVPTSSIDESICPHERITGSQTFSNIERNWTTNIILVDYDPLVINTTALLEKLPQRRTHFSTTTLITYNMDYVLYHANDTYANSLRQIILEHSIIGSDIGTKINESALALQRENPNSPIQVFDSRAGRSIDGFVIEDWVMSNQFLPAPSLGYNFYLLNLSELDTHDHETEHWFDYHPFDGDTGIAQDWFRLEFDHNLNPPIMMQYAGIGGRGNVYVLDPSADQWYMRWARIWWQDYITTDYAHWTKDLEDRTRELDLKTTNGVQLLNGYLRDYIYDIIAYLLFPYQHRPAKYVTLGEQKIEVINLSNDAGVSLDDLDWVTNADMQRTHLDELFPFVKWHVTVDFVDSTEDPFWNNTFWSFSSVSSFGITEVDGSSLFEHIYENVRPYRITTGPDKINVYGVVFIKKNMLMYYGDGTYTGLGFQGPDGGQTLICKSLERYYCIDNVTPREGISGIQLHETMHSLGFAHTWQHEHYASDFSYSPMGYFAKHNGTSSFDKNWVQGTYLDQMEIDLLNDFVRKQEYLTPDDPEKTLYAESCALQDFATARNLYNQMDWMGAYKSLCSARDWTKRMIYSRTDNTPPVIDSWGATPSIVNCTPFMYWAHVTDRSGLENVTLYASIDGGCPQVYECEYQNPNWVVSVPSISFQHNLSLWIVVYDWAMNRAEGGAILVTAVTDSKFFELILPPLLISGVTCIAIAVVISLKRKPTHR